MRLGNIKMERSLMRFDAESCQKWTRPYTGLTREHVLLTSHRRSLVKISSLAKSSWFHSSRSFSCPFQLSLSCSLVLKAVRGRDRKLGKDPEIRVRTIPYGQLSEPRPTGDPKPVLLEPDAHDCHFTLLSLIPTGVLYVPKYTARINSGNNSIFPFHTLTV